MPSQYKKSHPDNLFQRRRRGDYTGTVLEILALPSQRLQHTVLLPASEYGGGDDDSNSF